MYELGFSSLERCLFPSLVFIWLRRRIVSFCTSATVLDQQACGENDTSARTAEKEKFHLAVASVRNRNICKLHFLRKWDLVDRSS